MRNFEESGTFEEWFDIVDKKRGLCYPSARIPFRFYDIFLENIGEMNLKEVKKILRVLLRGTTLGIDKYMFDICPELAKYYEENETSDFYYCIDSDERYHRMLIGDNAWEGLTWGLDFLPVYPIKLIGLIEDCLIASFHSLPDDIIDGYYQAIDIIKKRFIDIKYPKEIFEALKPHEFEQLISMLYNKIGYKTAWTQATRDGGKDIIASKQNVYGNEYTYIECKKYKKTELKIETVRAFAYTVINDKVHKGIIFCTGYVPKTLYEYDQRIEIIDYDKLIELLNSYWGDWISSIGAKIYNYQRENLKSDLLR